MELVTLKNWVYDDTESLYVPDDAVGRHYDPNIEPSPRQPGVYQAEQLVENYTSLAWKESFRSDGEFELKTNDIQNTTALLPTGTLVSLRDSTEVYIVTTHYLTTDEENNDELTVSGKSLLRYLLENRVSWAYVDSGRSGEDANAVTTVNLIFQIPDHLAFVLWGGLVFPHSEGGYPNTRKQFELPLNISVPHSAVSVSVFENGDFYRTKWPAPQESRLDTTTGLLDLDQRFGVRSIRPTNTSAHIYTPTLDSLRGEGVISEIDEVDKLLFDVYQGVDRTEGDENQVIFRYDSGDIESAEYLSSIDGHKNVVNSYAERQSEQTTNRISPYYTMLLWDSDKWVENRHEPYNYSTHTWVGPIPRGEWYTLHTHTVQASGSVNIYSSWLFNFTPLYISRHRREIRIRKNGVQIGRWDHGGNRVMAQVWDSRGSIINHFLEDGDVLTLEAYANANNNNLRTLSNHSLRLEPVPHEDAFLTNENVRNAIQGIDFRLGAVQSSADTRENGLTKENRSQVRSDGLRHLKEHKEIEIVTADISSHSRYRYKEHYDLGDIVWVQGKFGNLQKMVVSEYTRTSDDSGVSGYPTLIKYEEPLD